MFKTVTQDLVEFDKYFGLKKANFTKIYGNGDCTLPPANAGWSLESSLDIEWAHVYAPKRMDCSGGGVLELRH